ncbi:hypothetical protein BASA81_013259 [Batrachochytrium salamandrivorans]|nr:hypothetical protein BASA81_013259 [Batrachochytrium salamandrivorans]
MLRFSSTLQSILLQRGIPKDSAAVVAKALEQTTSIISEQESYATILPPAALLELEKSYRRANPDSSLDNNAQVEVLDPHGHRFVLKGRDGQNLLQLAQSQPHSVLSDYLEFSCGGNMTCASCHVYVRRGYISPSEEEQDMIDLAWEPIDGVSRLGCQVCLSQHHVLSVELPLKALNHFK